MVPGSQQEQTMPGTFTISFPADLARAVNQTATERRITPEALVIECVADRLETAARYRHMLDRVEQIDQAILDLAELMGEAGAAGETLDLTTICRARCGADRRP
jgi:hypothetical protein